MNIPSLAERKVKVFLDKERNMVFNLNAMCAYEEITKKFFLSTVSELFEAMFPEGLESGKDGKLTPKSIADPMTILKKIPMVDLRALLWATIHDYDVNDNPVWPLTLGHVGKLLSLENLVMIFNSFMLGHSENSPTKTEMGESPAEAHMNDKSSPSKTVATGGEPFIALAADAFDSPPKS